MATSAMVADFKGEAIARLSSDERVRLGAERSARPVFAWFNTRTPVGGAVSEVDFVRCAAAQRHVRAMLVIPIQKREKFTAEFFLSLRNQNSASAFILESPDDALHDGNAAVLAHGAKPGPDFLAPTPVFEPFTPEDLVLVADKIVRRRVGASNNASQKTANSD